MRKAPIETYWIDYDGERVFYSTIPGSNGEDPQGYDQPTYVGHPWVVMDKESGANLGIWNPGPEDGFYRVVLRPDEV